MRARLVEDINFERNRNPKSAMGIGGISLGKERFDRKKSSSDEWVKFLENLLVGNNLTARMNKLNRVNKPGEYEFEGGSWGTYTTKVDKIHVEDIESPAIFVYGKDELGDNWQWALPIDDKKIYPEVINENQNFERGLSEPSDLGLGQWKEGPETIVPLHQFEENGGVLEKGREIWRIQKGEYEWEGYYLRYDPKRQTHLMYNDTWKSGIAISGGYGVKVKTKVLYR